jgi:hypothetical protein
MANHHFGTLAGLTGGGGVGWTALNNAVVVVDRLLAGSTEAYVNTP